MDMREDLENSNEKNTMEIKISEAAAAMGRVGGKSRSERKKLASRANGKLGGRPKKIQHPSQIP